MVIDVEAIARAVEACPSVARLTPGRGVEAATYLRGRRVQGIREVDGRIEVHVAARYGPPLPRVAGEIRNAVAAHVAGGPVAVFIDDLEVEVGGEDGRR